LAAFDVLVSPHVVTPFTLSLDAIKAYEYLATSRPIVATPTSGFQVLTADGLTVATRADFPTALLQAIERRQTFSRTTADWDDRTRQFAGALAAKEGRA
jgi:glycosyltransferase involved in cell wall biosynthesis